MKKISMSIENYDVYGVYHPAEKMTWNHPGSPEEFEATKIIFKGRDVLQDMPDDEYFRVCDLVLENLEM